MTPIFTVDSLSNVGFSWVAATANSSRMLWLDRLCQACGRKEALHGNHPPLCQSHISSSITKGHQRIASSVWVCKDMPCQLEFWRSSASMRKRCFLDVFLVFWDFRSMFRHDYPTANYFLDAIVGSTQYVPFSPLERPSTWQNMKS